MARRSRVKVSQYAVALIVAPGDEAVKNNALSVPENGCHDIFTEMEVLNFVVLGKCVWHHCSNCCFDIGVW
jgi:hypothetical protein